MRHMTDDMRHTRGGENYLKILGPYVAFQMSGVTIYMSHVRCHMSGVMFIFFIFYSVDGLLSTGRTPFSF